MSKAIENLEAAQKRAMAIRPRVGGFPCLAETLRRAGVTRNLWFLPACQSLFLTNDGPVVSQGTPLATGTMDVPSVQPRCADFGVAYGSGWGKPISGVSGGFLARRRCTLRGRLHCANGRILRLQWRGICRDLSQCPDRLVVGLWREQRYLTGGVVSRPSRWRSN